MSMYSKFIILPVLISGAIHLWGGAPVNINDADSLANADWQTRISNRNEPGEPLIVEGIVYSSDQKTVLNDITVEIYHTDARGLYGRKNGEPRLKGKVKTNSEGKYRFRTIKPAPYPGGRNPAHIHYTVYGPDAFMQKFELLFEGDSLITPQIKKRAASGDFFQIRPLKKDADGIYHCQFDIVLDLNASGN